MTRISHFHSPWASEVATEIALLLQSRKLMCNAGFARKPDGFSDLPQRRCIAALFYPLADDLEYLALAPTELVARVRLSGRATFHGTIARDPFLPLSHVWSTSNGRGSAQERLAQPGRPYR